MSDLSTQRRFVSPLPGDTIESIAARELPDLSTEDAIAKFSSRNLHIFLMRQPHGLVTGSDVVFVEPPQVEGGSMTLLQNEDLGAQEGDRA